METIILIAIWGWGAFKGWNIITGKSEWLDRKETVSYIVKGAICIFLGALFGLWALFKFSWNIIKTVF